MELKSIFKMEMFKNCSDRTYLMVIAVFTIVVAVTSFTGLYFIGNDDAKSGAVFIFIPLFVFSFIGLWAFSFLYPFHLLNMDYKNNVIGLIFASGVSREKYYFVKVGATILSCFIAMFIIMIIPCVTYLIVYRDVFVLGMQEIISSFEVSTILPFVLYVIMGLLSSVVTLTTAVIITKGKFVGIFISFLFMFLSSSIINAIISAISTNIYNRYAPHVLYLNILLLIINTCVFTFIGLHSLKKQNL